MTDTPTDREGGARCDNHVLYEKVAGYCFSCDTLRFDGATWNRPADRTAEYVAVLADHRFDGEALACDCGWRAKNNALTAIRDGAPTIAEQHDAHVAAMLQQGET